MRAFTHRRDMITVVGRQSAIIISTAVSLQLVPREVYVSSSEETTASDATQAKELGRQDVLLVVSLSDRTIIRNLSH